MKNYVAIFDWDKTIQRSYSFLTWSNLLVDKNIIDKNYLMENERKILQPLRLGRLNNDELADKGMKLFCKYIKNANVEEVKKVNSEYRKENDKLIYSILKPIFIFLNKNNIKTIVVSGAPQEILELYKKEFKIDKIYGLKFDVENGNYSGSFEINTGMTINKEKIVNTICKSKEILFAFGDSISDIPMFKKAKYSFVNNNEEFFKGDNIFYLNFSNEQSEKIIMEKINECLKLNNKI